MCSAPSRPSVAFNPLTWFHIDGGWHPELAPPLSEIYRQIKAAGFDSVHAEPPADMSTADYQALLRDVGLTPAPGYFQASFGDTEGLPAVIAEATRVAGQHAELGLSRIFIAEMFGVAPERLETPAVGAGADASRTLRIAENLDRVAAAMAAEGVKPCLHQHVGTLIETPDELEIVLTNTDPDALLFGPDTGHITWAGGDAAAIIERHLARVGAVHLKDLHRTRVEGARAGGLDYVSATNDRLWTEPGGGDVDFAAVLDVLNRFEGWYVVEVDVADQPTPADSARVSADWIKRHLMSQA